MRPDDLFPHEKDPTFQLLLELYREFAKLPRVRGTGRARDRMERRILKMVDRVVELADRRPRETHALDDALEACRGCAEDLAEIQAAGVAAPAVEERLTAVCADLQLRTGRWENVVNLQVYRQRAPWRPTKRPPLIN